MNDQNITQQNESFRQKLLNVSDDSTPASGYFSDKLETGTSPVSIPQIALPKGGGAIKGIDEQFQVNAVNGTAGYNIPIPITTGRKGFQPSLSLRYTSGAGNSAFGLGWDIDLSAIQRRTNKRLPRYDDEAESDVFQFSGAEDLQPYLIRAHDGKWAADVKQEGPYVIKRYRPRIESGFARIERIVHPDKGMYWKVTTPDNVVTFYGCETQSRIADPADARKIFKWLPCLSYNDKGDWIKFTYKEETTENIPYSLPEKNRLNGKALFTNRYLKTVQYGNQLPFYPNGPEDIYTPCPEPPGEHFFELVFDYGDGDGAPWQHRIDPFSDYHAGFEIRTYRLCRRVLLYHRFAELGKNPELVKSLELHYQSRPADSQLPQEVTYLKSVTRVGHARDGGKLLSRSLPPFEFGYQELRWDPRIMTVNPDDIADAPVGIGNNYQWMDLYSEGIAGILTEQGNAWYYKHNLGNGVFTAANLVAPKPSFNGLANGELQLLDLDANGRRHLVSLEHGHQGYFTLSDDKDWEPFRPFEGMPEIDLSDPYLRMIDLDGDGKPDLLVTEERIFRWYPSIGTKGFAPLEIVGLDGDEEESPRIVFADPEQTIFLADMSGDGLTDIVRIRNGSVCYWPNKGYGRFGARIQMANAPWFDHPDLFNPDYIQLADISGTGATDILYLGKEQFRAWLNLSGNAWSAECRIDPFFPTAQPDSLSVIDFLGNGTACIVWSSPLPSNAHSPMRYIDLMGGRKPHLLTSFDNHCGSETRLTYVSSTEFYIRDKKAGQPWVTKLPFPVQCVSKREVRERISDTYFVNTYDYHHGYFDHAEREFRGFGRVDQLDTQSFGAGHTQTAIAGNDSVSRYSNHQHPQLDQAPVLTKSWFHLGAYLQNSEILGLYRHEYWYNQPVIREEYGSPEGPEYILPDAVFIGELNNHERREAYRACKGMMLRQEIFAVDRTDKEPLPYSVAEHNCYVRKLQPLDGNRYAVFLVHESESISYSYERDITDPRVAHTLNIRLDELGNILQSASVVYPRKKRPHTLEDDAIWREQQKQHLLFTENKFTPDLISAGVYRLRSLFDTRQYEVNGLTPSGGRPFFTIVEFEIPLPGKKLVNHGKKLYLSNDLENPMPEGEMDSLGLPYESYQLVMTTAHLEHVFVRDGQHLIRDIRGTMEEAGYTDLGKDREWWARSGRMLFDHPAVAKKMFYHPRAYRDPFGATTSVKYYKEEEPETKRYWLMVNETIDALGNTVKCMRFNFRNLSPEVVRDANYNLSSALYDELGMVVATAIQGKEGQPVGDRLDDTVRAFLPEGEIRSFFEAPLADGPDRSLKGQTLLGHASTRTLYDYSMLPMRTATIVRETHFFDLAPDQLPRLQYAFDYYGGLGNTVLKKIQAPPGAAWSKTADGGYIWEDDVSPRWIGSGRTVLNNKGKPVKQYEPYFSASHGCEEEDLFFRHGVSPILHYDPPGRVIRTDRPDGTFAITKFDNWKDELYDANDTVLESRWYRERITGNWTAQGKDPLLEKQAAEKAAVHAGTYATIHLDSLGRAFAAVARDKWQATRLLEEGCREEITRMELDIKGNILSVTDARSNLTMQFVYDLPGNRIYQKSKDSGQRWILMNVAGKPMRAWDDRLFDFHYRYDILLRPTVSRIMGGEGVTPLNNLFGRMIYGESLLLPDRTNEAELRRRNILGKPIQQYDTGGVIDTPEYTFQGLPPAVTRRLFSRYKEVADWTDEHMSDQLEHEAFTITTSYDALNRIAQQTAPDGSIITPGYNLTGLFNTEHVLLPGATISDPYIRDIAYNEKGMRDRICYGNGVITTFAFDRETFRLLRLKSVRDDGASLQDWRYTYDPVGNLTAIEDKDIPTVFFNNQKITGVAEYTYDAVYRLIEASGRENNAALDFDAEDNWNDAPFLRCLYPGDPLVTRHYTQSYGYDAVGNILQMQHRAMGNSWTRRYTYQPSSDRLVSTQVGNQTYHYPCDPHRGFMTAMPQLEQMGWNFKNELVKSVRQRRTDGGTPETTWFQYDGQGQRIRKLTEKQAPPGTTPHRKEERIYIAGYEVYRRYQTDEPCFERTSLSLLDKGHRFVMVETVTRNERLPDSGPGIAPEESAGYRLTRYQLHNMQGSCALELDDSARVISYEEYHPFGTTAYQARNADIKAAAKRYRYTGMERDEETGLEYHSARYYVPWLGRWCSPDPIDIRDGVNEFLYCKDNPVNAVDPSGTQTADEIGRAMMWDRMGAELSAMWTGIFGGSAYISPARNVVQISAPTGGVGGVTGGVVRAATLRIVPIEDHPTLSSLYGMEMGAGLVPIADPAARLVTGRDVIGLEDSRGWAAVHLAVDVVPFALEFHAAAVEARMATMDARLLAMDSRLVSMDTRLAATEGDLLLDTGHIGAGEVRKPTITNPTCRGDLCVADVGAHQANLQLGPGDTPITNTEFVEASGRNVSWENDPLTNTGDATNFLNAGFEGLQSSGRISTPIRASIPPGAAVSNPGEYLAVVDGPMGGHAIHATVTEEVAGTRFIANGQLVSEEIALELEEEGVKVTRQNIYRVEFYDPQNGTCVMPGKVRSYIRLGE